MRNNQVNEILQDLLDFTSWRNPIQNVTLTRPIHVDLLKGIIEGIGEESIWDFYQEKIKWFKARVKKYKGVMNDFEEAKISVIGPKEKVRLVYREEVFEKERIF